VVSTAFSAIGRRDGRPSDGALDAVQPVVDLGEVGPLHPPIRHRHVLGRDPAGDAAPVPAEELGQLERLLRADEMTRPLWADKSAAVGRERTERAAVVSSCMIAGAARSTIAGTIVSPTRLGASSRSWSGPQ
jgi:hypothetical protein